MKKTIIYSFIAVLYISMSACSQSSRDESQSPPMGWNSWNWFGRYEVNESLIIEVIDAMEKNGLIEAGYDIIVLDGGWRSNKLSPNGELLAHPEKFPNGIKPLADYAHSKGLRFGIHTVPGTEDCAGEPVGAYGKEEIHVNQLIEWGVDFIKLDLCRFNGSDDNWDEQVMKDTYFKWYNLLEKKSPREIEISLSTYKYRDWSREVGVMARTTQDIVALVAGMPGIDSVTFNKPLPMENNPWNMVSVMEVVDENNKWASKAGNGFWNDPDMLITGNHGLTEDEQRSHFSLWCIMSSPLFLGNDPRNMSAFELDLITDPDAIAVNQDPTEQGRRIKKEGDAEIFIKKLKDGHIAVLLLNRNDNEKMDISINFNELNLSGEIMVKEIYQNQEVYQVSNSITRTLNPHESSFLILNKL